MQRCNIPADSAATSFDSALWRAAFDMMFALLSSDEVVIEAFGPQVSAFAAVFSRLFLSG